MQLQADDCYDELWEGEQMAERKLTGIFLQVVLQEIEQEVDTELVDINMPESRIMFENMPYEFIKMKQRTSKMKIY